MMTTFSRFSFSSMTLSSNASRQVPGSNRAAGLVALRDDVDSEACRPGSERVGFGISPACRYNPLTEDERKRVADRQSWLEPCRRERNGSGRAAPSSTLSEIYILQPARV